MKTVWKSHLKPTTEIQALALPCDARVVSAKARASRIAIWYECSPDAPKAAREFVVFATGRPIPESYRYLATVQRKGHLFHIYEIVREGMSPGERTSPERSDP